MKRIWRFFWVGILALLGLLLGFALVLVLINSFDEDLAPETKALSVAPSNPYKAEQNLYLALTGIDAPPGQSSIAFAQARIAKYERDLPATLKDPSIWVAKLQKKDAESLVFKGKTNFGRPLTSSVWTGIESHHADIKALVNDNHELYQRYLALHDLEGYYDTATPSMYAPMVYPPTEVRSLFLANFALRMKTGNPTQQRRVLADLEGDFHVWHAMLVGEGPLVSKMLAVAYLQGDYLLLADMVADESIDVSALSPELDGLATIFDLADWRIGKSFAHEFRMTAPLWEQMDPTAPSFWANSADNPAEQPTWWERCWNRLGGHFFKKQATENLSAKSMLQVIAMANAKPADLDTAREVYSRWVQEHLSFALHYVYNPIGKVLVAIAVPAYETYPLRAYDVAALQRAVKLAYDLRKQRIPAEAIPEFLRQHPEWATHPVSGQAFSWDADKNEIAVKPLVERNDRRFSIPVWTRAKTIVERSRVTPGR